MLAAKKKKKIVLRRIYHRAKWRIAILFDYDEKLKLLVRSINGCVFSSTFWCFYVDESEENLKADLKVLKEIAEVDISSLVRKEEPAEESNPGRVLKDFSDHGKFEP